MDISSVRPARRFVTTTIAVLTLALVSCTKDSAPDSGSGSAAKSYRIAVVPKGTTHVFWKSIHAGALAGAEAVEAATGNEVTILWQGPLVEDQREAQRQVLESFIGQNVDGIVFAPIDKTAMVMPVSAAMAAGKPVVIIDSGLDGENFVSFVATDNYKGGALAGRHLGELMGGKGKALLLRYQEGSASTMRREQGFIDALKEQFPEIELVPPGLQQYAGATTGHAQEASEVLLNTYADVSGIFCPNESSTTGMLQALKQSGRAGKIRFIGFDASKTLVDALEAGHVDGLILQSPVRMGKLGVETLLAHLRGEDVEKRVDTGVFLVTRETMSSEEHRALLNPDLSSVDG